MAYDSSGLSEHTTSRSRRVWEIVNNRLQRIVVAISNWLFHRPRFCYCLPIRIGVMINSTLTLLISGFASIILWFEISTTHFSSKGTAAMWVFSALVETLLFIAAFIGFVGAVGRSLRLLISYASFLYIHFIINLSVAIYFLVSVSHAANLDIVVACYKAIKDPQGQKQCKSLLVLVKAVISVLATLILVIELYGAFMSTRYITWLRTKKAEKRRTRIAERDEAYAMFHKRFSTGASSAKQGLLDEDRVEENVVNREFDPYQPYGRTPSPLRSSMTFINDEEVRGEAENKSLMTPEARV